MTTRSLISRGTLLAATTIALLAACASPDPRYYSLAASATSATSAAAAAPVAPMAPVSTPSAVTTAAGTGTAAAPAERLWIEVAPVRVPERLNRPQIVVNDGADGQLRLLELDRWSAPLPDELRDALSQRLQTTLGAVDTYQQGLSDVAPVYRVTTEVVRLDGSLGERAGATITWTVRRLPDGQVVSGRTLAEVPAPGQVDGMVAAYRQIVASAADEIAAGVRSLGR